jgi:hypothetical protein
MATIIAMGITTPVAIIKLSIEYLHFFNKNILAQAISIVKTGKSAYDDTEVIL